MVVGCGVVTLSLLCGDRAQACLEATEDIKVLLGEANEGLVWAILNLSRREDDKEPDTFWWRLQGHVELAPYDGSGPKVVPELTALSAAFKSQQGRGRVAHYAPPIKAYVDSLAGRIKLPGFRRPRALRQYECDHVRACGPWRLQVEGQSLVAKRGEALRTVANLEKFAGADNAETIHEDLRLMEIREYQLAAAKVFVLNLAVGDYHSTYGEDEPPETTKPAPMRLIRKCQGVACYRPTGPMHHGNHIEVSVPAPLNR